MKPSSFSLPFLSLYKGWLFSPVRKGLFPAGEKRRSVFLFFFVPLMASLTACSSSYSPPGHYGPPAVIAHRGASAVAPENSIPAVKAAWEQGADAVEVDVRISGDQQLVLIHDRTTERTTGMKLQVSRTPYEQLQELDAGSWFDPAFEGTRIPLLDSAMDHVPPHKELLIEFKCGTEGISLLEELLSRREVIPPFSIISFNREVVAMAKERFPEIPAYWVLSRVSPLSPTIRRAQEVSLNGLNIKQERLMNGERVRKAREKGLHVLSWTVNDSARAIALRRMGVQGIVTDEVKAISRALSGMKE